MCVCVRKKDQQKLLWDYFSKQAHLEQTAKQIIMSCTTDLHIEIKMKIVQIVSFTSRPRWLKRNSIFVTQLVQHHGKQSGRRATCTVSAPLTRCPNGTGSTIRFVSECLLTERRYFIVSAHEMWRNQLATYAIKQIEINHNTEVTSSIWETAKSFSLANLQDLMIKKNVFGVPSFCMEFNHRGHFVLVELPAFVFVS